MKKLTKTMMALICTIFAGTIIGCSNEGGNSQNIEKIDEINDESNKNNESNKNDENNINYEENKYKQLEKIVNDLLNEIDKYQVMENPGKDKGFNNIYIESYNATLKNCKETLEEYKKEWDYENNPTITELNLLRQACENFLEQITNKYIRYQNERDKSIKNIQEYEEELKKYKKVTYVNENDDKTNVDDYNNIMNGNVSDALNKCEKINISSTNEELYYASVAVYYTLEKIKELYELLTDYQKQQARPDLF